MDIRNISSANFDNTARRQNIKKDGGATINTRDSFLSAGAAGDADPGAKLKNLSAVLKDIDIKIKQMVLFSVPISDAAGDKSRGFPAPEPVVGYDGSIYTNTMDGKLKALDSRGNLKWEYETNGSTYITPAVGLDGTIAFYGSDYRSIIALNSDGTEKFKAAIPDSPYRDPQIDDNGNIYFRTRKHLHKINNQGETEWSREIPEKSGFLLTPDGRILVPSGNGIKCFNESQETQWQFNPKGSVDAPLAFGTDSKMMIVENGHFKIIGKDGNVSVETKINDEVRGEILVDHKDNSYFGGKSLHAMGADGKLLWQFDTGGNINRKPAIGQDGVIYAVSDQELFAVKDGKMQWKAPLADSEVDSVNVSPDGNIYIDNGANNIEIFNKDGKKQGDFNSPDGSFKAGGLHRDGFMIVCDHKNLYALKERSLKEVAADIAGEVKNGKPEEKSSKIETQGDWVIIGGVRIPRRRNAGL